MAGKRPPWSILKEIGVIPGAASADNQRSESQHRPHEDFALGPYRAADVNNATRTADDGDLRVYHYRQPFRLDLESDVSTRIEPHPTADPEREAREAKVRVIGNVRGAHT